MDSIVTRNNGYFNLANDGQSVEVRPTQSTVFHGLKVYEASGYIELSWSQIFKSILTFSTVFLYKAIPFGVATRYM